MKNSSKQLSVLLSLLFIINSAFAATSGNGYIVKLKKGSNTFLYEAENNVKLKSLAPNGLYLAQPKAGSEVSAQSVVKARGNKNVSLAQPNHKVTLRKGVPNDKDFARQWNYDFNENTFGVDALGAWDEFGHKGQIVYGDDIVIAVVDGGFDPKHGDLINNIWINKGEIAGNNIDDDGNGYVDDVNGWDIESNSGEIQMDSHGTHVAGIMGAQGDNNLNGAGINWNVKIMYVSAGWGLGDTATTMSAYGYILKQKQIWLESDGKRGANVVAINSSFGIDRADCNSSEYSAWNDMFNELGKAGILSVAATANSAWDVDVVGDVPTACNSPYVISVTNTDISGHRNDAGFGKTTIDLAAPGENVFSTLPDNDFGSMSGTSMATPHVTGSVGFLYSVANVAFIDKSLANPGEAALEVKEALLRTVTARPDLKNETVSGGILNLAAASRVLATYAPRCN